MPVPRVRPFGFIHSEMRTRLAWSKLWRWRGRPVGQPAHRVHKRPCYRRPTCASRPGDRGSPSRRVSCRECAARGGRLTAEEEAAAIAEIRHAAAGRADLLAERAGIALGYTDPGCDAARCRQIAKLCIAAEADQALMEHRIMTGRKRAAPR
jgi:hypothetical protein